MSLSRSGSGSSFEELSRPAEGWQEGPDPLTTPTEKDASAGFQEYADEPAHPAAIESRLSRAPAGDTDQEHLTDVFVPDTPAPAQQSRSVSSPRANDQPQPEPNKTAVREVAPVVSDPDSEQLAHVDESEDTPPAPLPVPPPFMLTSALEPALVALALITMAVAGCVIVSVIGPSPMSIFMIILILALAMAPLGRLVRDLRNDQRSFAKLPEYARPVYRLPKDQRALDSLFLLGGGCIFFSAILMAIATGRVHNVKGPSIATSVPMPHAQATNSTSIPSANPAAADPWHDRHASMAELRELMATQTATMQRQMDEALRALHAAVDPVRAGEASGAWGACEQETEWLACEQALQTADQQMETKEKLVSALTLKLGQCQGALDEMHRAQQAYAQAQAANNPPPSSCASDANGCSQSQGSANRKPARSARSTHAPGTQDKPQEPSKRTTADAAASGEHAMLWSVSPDAIRAAREQAAAAATATITWAQAAAQQSAGAVRSGWKAAADRLSQLHGGVVAPAAGRVQERVRAIMERERATQERLVEAGRKRAEEVVAEVQARNAVLRERVRKGVEGVMRAVQHKAEVSEEVMRASMEGVMRTVKESAEAAHARVKKAKVATRVQLDPVASRVSRFAQWVGNKTEGNTRVQAARKATRAQLGRFAQWVGNKAGHPARSKGGNAKSKAGK